MATLVILSITSHYEHLTCSGEAHRRDDCAISIYIHVCNLWPVSGALVMSQYQRFTRNYIS